MTEMHVADGDNRYRLLKVALERFGCDPSALDEKQQRQAERIVGRQLQIEEAVLRSTEAAGVVIPESQVDEAWKGIAERYEDDQALEQALEANGLDAGRVRTLLGRELKVEAILERVSTGLPPISDTDVSLYYFSHLEQFEKPETRKARHILITINEEYAENKREVALSRARTIARRLMDKPDRFAEQAMKHSECPTSLQGGVLGEVKRGTLFPELEKVLFELEVGQLSDAVESPLGYHLLVCDGIDGGRRMTLDEVMPKLREWLESRQRQARQREWLEQLLNSSAS